MTILLDENFPLGLYRRLLAAGYQAEHIIALGQRGLPDSIIRDRLMVEDLTFLTLDTEFLDLPADHRAVVIISNVPQGLPIKLRIEIWFAALESFVKQRPAGTLFQLFEDGAIVPWTAHDIGGAGS